MLIGDDVRENSKIRGGGAGVVRGCAGTLVERAHLKLFAEGVEGLEVGDVALKLQGWILDAKTGGRFGTHECSGDTRCAPLGTFGARSCVHYSSAA